MLADDVRQHQAFHSLATNSQSKSAFSRQYSNTNLRKDRASKVQSVLYRFIQEHSPPDQRDLPKSQPDPREPFRKRSDPDWGGNGPIRGRIGLGVHGERQEAEH